MTGYTRRRMRSVSPGSLFISQAAPRFLAHLREARGDLRGLVERFSLPENVLELEELELPLRRYHALTDAIAEELGDPMMGIHHAVEVAKGRLGLIEFLMRASSTLQDAVDVMIQYSTLCNALLEMSLELRDDDAIFTQRIAGEPLACGRQTNEFYIAYALRIVRELTGRPVEPRRVWFAHPRPADIGPIERAVFTTQITFNAGENGIALERSLLEAPLGSAEPALRTLLEKYAERVNVERPGRGTLIPRVRAAIEASLSDGPPTAERVAKVMQMSSRTLQRRLASDGTTFQEVLDSVRQLLALRYLRERQIQLGEIAFRLGYADSRVLVRAFKRWTGVTPGAYRQQSGDI
jgi:AraC-like DNA-binding protein